MMKSEIGYEHYFLNYFLYLPFSQIQEDKIIKDSLKYMNELGLVKFSKIEDIKIFMEDVNCLFEEIKKYCESDVKLVKQKLKLMNKRRIDVIIEELRDDKIMKKYFPISSDNIFSIISSEKKLFFDENEKIMSNIIYDDYKYNNENVEVYLHQRTMKKVRYKKRSYNLIHPINNELIQKLIKESDSLFNEMNSSNCNLTNDSLTKEMNFLREKF